MFNFLSNQETGQLFPLNTRESIKQNNNEQEDNNSKKQQQWYVHDLVDIQFELKHLHSFKLNMIE